ncbi:hypothetical protein B0H13DRAFT_1899468 [Mycena leptocephala]|nr:hypothetical protein B0H13DRAFT_1899468 [Mycena leptocephala]
MVRQDSKAAKQREANRRYYEMHPEIKEKNRVSIAVRRIKTDTELKREAKKKYRRQWDPPKKNCPAVCDEDSLSAQMDKLELTRNETAAHAALSAMYRLSIRGKDAPASAPDNRKEPKSLAEIAAYESSRDDSSQDNDTVNQSLPRKTLQMTKRNTEATLTLEARLDAERAARMRIVVESSRSFEAVASIHQERGSVGVEKWLRGIQASST